jgi:hypothetical protein
MRFEPAGVRYGIPAVGLPAAMPYGGRIVGANGLSISTPCPRKLASERLVSTTAGLLPVVGIDFRGPWHVGYASLARVSPAGIATLPDGSHVRVSGIGPSGRWAPFSLPQRRVPWPDARRAGTARVGADSDDWDPTDDPSIPPIPAVVPSTLNALGAVPKVLVPTANDFGQILGPAGSNTPLGRAEIDEGLSAGADFWANLGNTASTAISHLPSFGQFTTLLVCVLVAVGVWFLWPILSGLRRVGV